MLRLFGVTLMLFRPSPATSQPYNNVGNATLFELFRRCFDFVRLPLDSHLIRD